MLRIWRTFAAYNSPGEPATSKGLVLLYRDMAETLTYSEKLKSPKWQKRRLEILNRDFFRCVMCGDTETELQVHHKKYNHGEPWDAKDSDLITLCKHCHKDVEFFKKTKDFSIDDLKVLLIKHPDDGTAIRILKNQYGNLLISALDEQLRQYERVIVIMSNKVKEITDFLLDGKKIH